jgi:membrane-associated protein
LGRTNSSRIEKEPGGVLESLLHFLHRLFNPEELQALIGQAGPPLVCAIVFVETGFFVGFFLPGDSLLITAGIVAYGVLQVSPQALLAHWLLPVIACAVVGDQVGYWIGRSAGAALYKREDSFFFRKSHLQRAHDFYEKYGGRAVILARFMPIVRTFCPPVAGAAKMSYARYLAFDIFGGMFWVTATIAGGYLLGRSVPNIGNYIHYVILVVVIVSILPALIGVMKSRKAGGPTGAPSSEKS